MMTIEEKAKAYDEAISRAKDSYGTGAYDDATTEFIFPELSESEDRKHTTQGVLNAFNKKNGGEIINSKNKPSRDALLESAKKLLDGCNGIWWSDGELKKAILKDFPELAESEDEKIRKAIISYLYNELNNFKQPTPRTNEFESWLAYLEKQKEQKVVEVKDICVHKMVDKYRCTDEYDDEGNLKGKPVNCMIRAYEQGIRDILKIVRQKPAEWSEADEYRFELLIAMCEDEQNESSPISTNYREMLETKDWLENRFKSLRPQPKREWSEEDEKRLNRISWYLTHKGYKDDADWLKSLIPSWKPSEE